MSKVLPEKTKEVKIKPGNVVIVGTGQAGTLWWITEKEVAVLLANGDIWYGPMYQIRLPQNDADLKACPRDVPKFVKPYNRSED